MPSSPRSTPLSSNGLRPRAAGSTTFVADWATAPPLSSERRKLLQAGHRAGNRTSTHRSARIPKRTGDRDAVRAMTPTSLTALPSVPQIVWFNDPGAGERSMVGGKAAALARAAADHTVPPGFTVVGDVSEEEVLAAYARLAERLQRDDPAVAVRSSAADEDGSETSFAAQHEPSRGISGADGLLEAITAARASAHSDRALASRRANCLHAPSAPLPI